MVTKANDTITGELHYRGDLALSYHARFRTPDGDATTYAPGEIAAYRFDGGRSFVSEEVDGEKVFLERLTDGRISLYYYRDTLGNHYYVDKPGLELSELEYRESIKYVNGRRVYNESKSHILRLNYFMQDLPDAAALTEDLGEPKHNALIKLLREYHEALGIAEKFTVLKEQPPLIVPNPELLGGFATYTDVPDLTASSYYPVGAVVHFWSPRVNEKLYFRTGVLYSRLQLETGSKAFFKIPLQLEYIYPSGAFRPRIAFGPIFNNLTAHTVSGNVGAFVRVGPRVFLSLSYGVEFEQDLMIVPTAYLAQSFHLGCAVMLSERYRH